MALTTPTTPLAPQSQTEWLAELGLWRGTDYSRDTPAVQAFHLRLLQEAFEYANTRFNKEPWAIREASVTPQGANLDTLVLGTDVSKVIRFRETDGEVYQTPMLATKTDFYDALKMARAGSPGTLEAAHPWGLQRVPTYYFDGMTDDTPVKRQQWKRIGSAAPAGDVTVLYHPYFNSIADTNEMPASYMAVVRHHWRSRIAALEKNQEEVSLNTQLREDEISAVQVSETSEPSNHVIYPGNSPEFYNEQIGP